MPVFREIPFRVQRDFSRGTIYNYALEETNLFNSWHSAEWCRKKIALLQFSILKSLNISKVLLSF